MTVLKLGYSDPRTDTFGAHPVLGPVLDLNDGQTFVLLAPEGLELPPPPRTLVPAGNIRTQGERGVRAIYRHSREVTVRLVLGPAANYASLAATIRTLLAWVNAPPALPVTLQYQPFGATSMVYLDVIGCAHDLPASESDWLRLQLEPIELVFVCRPGLRGDRVTLANAVANAGFEQGSGPGVQVFADALATLNAYSVQAGGALGQDTLYYVDTVLADAPLRYYRLDEPSGTTVYDASTSAQNATHTVAPTLGVAGALATDADTAVTYNGTTQYTTGNATTGLPTGAGAITLEAWIKVAALPGAFVMAVTVGTQGAGTVLELGISSTNKPYVGNETTNVQSATNVVTGAWQHFVGTYDGTNLRLYVNGSLVAGPTAATNNLGSTSLRIGTDCNATPTLHFFPGSVDEVAVYGSALSAARVTAHYNAGNAPTGQANTLQIPAGGRVKFGSPAWGAIQQWQVRFRAPVALTSFFLHYTDANNYLAVNIGSTAGQSPSSNWGLYQQVAGAGGYLATGSTVLIAGKWYGLRVTQFPAPPASTSGGISDPAAVQATLLADNAGVPGVSLGTVGPVPVNNATVAVVGAPQVAAPIASPVVIGGAFASVHTVALFGPGGWLCTPLAGAATGTSSGAWEGDQTRGASGAVANTYPNGPVTSNGAARLDLAPAGTVDALWRLYAGGAPANTSAIPIATAGNVVYARVAVKSAGLGNGCTVALKFGEYDSTGVFLRAGTLQTLTIAGGVQLAWPAAGVWNLSGNWTTGANCAYVDLQVEVADTVAGNSANGTVWLDNAQAWDSTRLGTTAMPYAETRFAQSPAQLVLTGLLGDLPAPAQLQLGTYVSAWNRGGVLTWALGRLGAYRPGAVLAGPSHGFYATAPLTPQATPVLDAAGYGGWYVKATVDSGGWQPRALSARVSDLLGTYHLWTRYKTADPTPSGVQLRVQADEALHGWYSDALGLAVVGTYYGPYVTPLAGTGWTLADAGQQAVPPWPVAGMADPSQLYLLPRGLWVGTTGGGSEGDASWMALVPVDGSLLLGTVNYPSNNAVASQTGYVWVYSDGLLVNQGAATSGPSASYSLESSALPNVAHAGGGVGTLTTSAVNVNSGADPYLTLDPTLGQWNGAGVSQAVGVIADEQATVLPLSVEVVYSPLYLEPR